MGRAQKGEERERGEMEKEMRAEGRGSQGTGPHTDAGRPAGNNVQNKRLWLCSSELSPLSCSVFC